MIIIAITEKQWHDLENGNLKEIRLPISLHWIKLLDSIINLPNPCVATLIYNGFTKEKQVEIIKNDNLNYVVVLNEN